MSKSDPPSAVNESKKGDVVTFEYRGFRVVGRVRRVLKDGTRTVEITEADPGFERHMAQDIDEGILVDIRH
jgi:hypothetical protein